MKMIEDKAAKRPTSTKAAPARTAGDVVDLVKILQESIAKSGRGGPRNNAAAKEEDKAASTGTRGKSTATLVKQRRRKGAL
jgi:non-homologous end joining protein Ku